MTKQLTEEQLVSINKMVIEKYSPLENSRLVSPSALNMIVNLPEQYVFGKELYPTLMEKATVLFVQLIKKRVLRMLTKEQQYSLQLLF